MDVSSVAGYVVYEGVVPVVVSVVFGFNSARMAETAHSSFDRCLLIVIVITIVIT